MVRPCQVAKVSAVLLLALGAAGRARAQPPELVTDRPDQTESAMVVSRGLVQVETGYLFVHDADADRHEVPGTLFRIGLGGRTEFRIGYAGVVSRESTRGSGDSELGAKVNLIGPADGGRTELAILGGMSLPTGDDGLSSGGADPAFLVSLAHELSPRVSLGYNIGARGESSPDRPGRDAFIVYSSVLGLKLTDRLGTFLELFGDRQVSHGTVTRVSVDGGLTVLLTDTLQLDVSVGRGLPGPADDLFVGTGLSFRLPR
jgi:Putative MetA-pathway of phenol degradation